MRKSVRATGLSAAVLAIGIGLAVTTNSPASAAETCPANKYCLYDGAGYTTLIVSSDERLVRWIGATANDRVSSIVNNTNDPLHLFKDVNWEKPNGSVEPHTKVVLLPSQNNNISSYYLY
jgi:hypothetical protein